MEAHRQITRESSRHRPADIWRHDSASGSLSAGTAGPGAESSFCRTEHHLSAVCWEIQAAQMKLREDAARTLAVNSGQWTRPARRRARMVLSEAASLYWRSSSEV